MLTQVQSVTTNGIQQKSDFARAALLTCPVVTSCHRRGAARTFRCSRASALPPPNKNPRVTSVNFGLFLRWFRRWRCADFTYAKADDLTRVFQLQRARHRSSRQPATHTRHNDLQVPAVEPY